MAITGGIKFFKENKAKSASASSSISGTASVLNLLNSNVETFWRSSGSSDSITEEIIITFSGDKTIDRLLIANFNGKLFNAQYDASGVWTSFANVVGLDGSVSGISETTYDKDTAYYEFDSVTTGAIRIQITSTQTADQEKFINQVIATEELGTFVGYPKVSNISLGRNQKSKRTLNGKFSIQKSIETLGYKLAFSDYPSLEAYNADIDLVMTLLDSEDPFIPWLCGGRYGSDYFRYTLRGFKLTDLPQMQVANTYSMSYSKNIYTNQVNISSVDLVEVI